MRKEIEDVANELDGFEDLEPTDQEKIMAAFALGHVREQGYDTRTPRREALRCAYT